MTIDYLNRIGLTLQFISLFLVTPDILGQERMEVVRGQLSSVMTRLDRVPQTLRYAVAGLSIGLFVPAFFYYYLLRDVYPKNVRLGFLLLLVPSIYFLCMLVAYLLMKFWNYTKTSGKSLFLVGAILFTGGFICLLWATFLPVV